MNKKIVNLLKLPDEIISKKYLKNLDEKKSLITVLFHGIFKNKDEIKSNNIDPQLGISINNFKKFLYYFKKYDYNFVSPNDILNGLNPDENHILISFDDGYYNNINILPLLEKFKVPAVFFISTEHIKKNKSYWWDVHYRENILRGKSIEWILSDQKKFKNKKSNEIEKILTKQFGQVAFNPKSDIDRPFTIDELKNFSKEKYVTLGNHTSNHAILTNYSDYEIKQEIEQAQTDIKKITNIEPIIISYPNGNFSENIVSISKKIGLKIGLTLLYKKNYLPFEKKDNFLLKLGRFELVEGYDIEKQCRLFRSDIVFYRSFVNLMNKNY